MKSAAAKDRRRFVHERSCPCYGFLSLLNARRFVLMGWCGCDVPMTDGEDTT